MKRIIGILSVTAFFGCSGNGDLADAYGNFESEEITISAEVSGELLSFEIEEGDQIELDQVLGQIDTTSLSLQKMELEANLAVIEAQYSNLAAEISALETERDNVERELERTRKLVETKAATTKQLDDLEGMLASVNKRIKVVESKNPSIASQLKVNKAKIDRLEDMINRCNLKAPRSGVVLNKIAREHQLVMPGSPLYTMADLSVLDLRAYVTGNQLSQIGLGEAVDVMIDGTDDELITYKGKITWIADQAEFTPKIIQTKEERVDMVYAMKVAVVNDGKIKIGMPGEVVFSHAEDQ
jgi:HlyD family secretion protein